MSGQQQAHTCVDGIKRALAANTTSQVTAGDLSFLYKTIVDWQAPRTEPPSLGWWRDATSPF